jgi:YbbR domain-containing protein
MDHKLSKVLPLRFSKSGASAQNLRIIGAVEVSPDSVHVTGPRHLLKNMKCLYTANLNLPAFEGVVERQVALVVPVGTSVAEGASARVRFLVQRMKKRTFEVTILAQNVPFGEDLKLLPGAVTVNFLATDSTFSKLSKNDFAVVADYRDLILSQNKIEVQLLRFPSEIESPSLSPAKVEYLLRK